MLIISYIYELPFRGTSSLARRLLGNWELSGINQMQSGSPFSVRQNVDYAGVGAGSGNQFWNLTGDPSLEPTAFVNDATWFNKAAFAQPAAGTFGQQPRNILRNPGFWEWDLGIRKNFPVTEKQRLQFRTEMFNVVNHPNWGGANAEPDQRYFRQGHQQERQPHHPARAEVHILIGLRNMRTRPLLLAAGFLGLAGNLHNQNRQEWVRHVIAEGFSNQTAVAADFTGDGRPDVITGDITPNRERTILYVAPDWKPVVLYTGIRTIHGAVIDVDGDGKPDFVAARYHPGLVYWLEHPADPVHEPWPYHLVDDAAQGGADGVHGLWAGDIDRDGKIDLAASSGQPKGGLPDSLVWFRIPPQPRTAARWERYVVADRDAPGLSHYVSLGDVNGDGRPDLAAASKDSPGGNWSPGGSRAANHASPGRNTSSRRTSSAPPIS